MLDIYVDADACPVKEEAMRVAERHGLQLYMVSNSGLALHRGRPPGPNVHRVMVERTPDAADNWIAEKAGAGDIVITADIPLASRGLANGAHVIGPTGKRFTRENIGTALAMRELNAHLRETGESKGFNASFSKQDRSRFLQELELVIQLVKRGQK